MKVQKRLKDVTPNEYIEWRKNICGKSVTCNDCPLCPVPCEINKACWVINKKSYPKNFLNRKIEVETKNNDTLSSDGLFEKEILTEKEKEYLKSVIKPFKDKVEYITKNIYSGLNDKFYYFIMISIKSVDGAEQSINLPYFKIGSDMYSGMRLRKFYVPKGLGLIEREEK